jgi:hypothetical protein
MLLEAEVPENVSYGRQQKTFGYYLAFTASGSKAGLPLPLLSGIAEPEPSAPRDGLEAKPGNPKRKLDARGGGRFTQLRMSIWGKILEPYLLTYRDSE